MMTSVGGIDNTIYVYAASQNSGLENKCPKLILTKNKLWSEERNCMVKNMRFNFIMISGQRGKSCGNKRVTYRTRGTNGGTD